MTGKILIVEDNADLHLGLALRLKSAGYIVFSAMNGEEAVPIVRRDRPDVILLDIGLPGCSGHAVAHTIAEDPEIYQIPVIFLTGRDEPGHRQKAAQEGAAAYLLKPCSLGQLLDTIVSIIGHNDSDRPTPVP